MQYFEDKLESRGHQFTNTAFREIFYSRKLMKDLAEKGIQCGNEPIGVWQYEPNLGGKLTDETPEIEKFCGLYKTYGDKRLASHLIAGVIVFCKRIIHLGVDKGIITNEMLDELKLLFQ